MHKIAAVIVTYNRKELLRQCLACVAAQRGAVCELWVVDNASTDGTAQFLQEYSKSCPQLHNVTLLQNLGGAGGFWMGMKLAAQAGCDAVWLMDDDTLPKPEALAQLLAADKSLGGDYGWLSSRAVSRDGADQPMNRQRKTPYREIDGYDGGQVPAVMASFVSLFLRTETVYQFGLPLRDFFIWSDDWEYTRRISRKRPCFVVPQSVVVHAMKNGSVVNIAYDTPQRLPRYRYFYRNDVVLYRREGMVGWLWLLAKDLWHSVQVICAGKEKRQKLGVLWHGFAEGVRFRPMVEFPDAPAGEVRHEG